MIRIVPYEPSHRDGFVRLNRGWIEEYFRLEPQDEALFSDVDGRVAEGAIIVIADDGGEAVGTCMGTPLGGGVWEVEKLTTDERYRGRGIATALLRECLSRIRDAGGTKVVLLTNSRLEGAVRIYEKEGFRRVPVDPSWGYERVDLQFEMDLTAGSSGRPS